jgi:hypothetical protein
MKGFGAAPRSHRKKHFLISGAPDRIRTCDLWNRNPTLYPAELRVLGLNALLNQGSGAINQKLLGPKRLTPRRAGLSMGPSEKEI